MMAPQSVFSLGKRRLGNTTEVLEGVVLAGCALLPSCLILARFSDSPLREGSVFYKNENIFILLHF